jgi:putative glutamine amidotransferase
MCSHNIHQGYHNINIAEDSLMFDIFNLDKLPVNSQHHQSIKVLGGNLKITSISSDGIVESIESTNDKFVLAVQFHPEAMLENDNKFRKFFRCFVEKCK